MADREKVITGLECCSMNGNGCKRCPYNKECDVMPDFGNAHLCSDALELLREQPQWISVDDRLPDKQPDEYLVVNGHSVETAICLDNMWITPRRVTKITHWMPLPEPPKEESDD